MRKARFHRLLALFLVMCMLCSTSLPVYAEALPMPSDEATTSTETPAADTENISTTETATSTETNIDNSDVTEPVSESGLSEAAQAFVDTVAALDRDAIVSASNAWGLASKAWQADKNNKELENALNEAISVQEQVCAPLTTADDLYNALSEDDRNNETVAAAYARFEEIWTAMIRAMENPVDNSDTSDEPTELTDIVDVMYPGLPVAPTGYYLDSNGLPVVTGETMISIEGWGTEDYSAYDADSETQVALDADLLEAASATASFPRMDGASYAIVPISIQVLYPANGSSAEISLPENVTLLGYSFTSDNLIEATEDERSTMLHYDFSEISASVAGIYVMANSNFEATLTYTDDSQTLTKKLSVTIDDSAPQSGILQDRFSQESATSTYALNATPRAGLQVTQCINTSIGWMNYLGGMPVLCADHGKWAWGPGATYANKYPPVASYSAAGSVWVDASAFGKGWEADQATIWSVGFNNGTPAGARSSTYSLEGATGDTSYYDRLSWQASAYPDSIAASIVDDLNKAVPYLGPGESQTVYLGTLYTPSNSAWQRFVYLDYTPVVLGGDTEIPGLTPEGQPIEIPWQASYERTATLDLEYTVQIDKSANITHEKLDDAIFTITANQTGGSISGGTWSIDEPQKVVTTVDGAASATWVVHYEVTKSASQSGSVTANSEQDAITNGQTQANQQQAAAQAACEAQVNGEIDAALAAAKEQLSQLTFSYEETTVPHGFDPTDSSSGSVSVPSNGSTTAVVANQPWQAHVTWEKRDALTGGRITEDAEYVFYEWNVDANEYEISSNYRVTRLENGLYTVTVTNPVYTDWTEGYVYYTQDNLGKFRIEEVTAPAGYTDAALQGTDWVEHWSQEFEITASDQTYSYTGDDADYNRPQGNKVIIKKIEAHTGEIIVDDAVFTLYQWNEERGLYEKSKDYAFVRDTEGLYTITCLHDDWSQYEEGNLYYEDTLCDVREDTVNSDGTTTEHPQYYTDYEPIDFSIDERAVTTDGQFVVVESKSPYGYYGDWTGSRETPNFEVEDAGKHAYYIRLTDDGSTITLTDSEYNAHVLTENKGGTLIELGDGSVVTLDVFSPALEEYDENNLFRNNPWYSTVVWEKRDALTGGLVDADTTFEIQEWNPEKGEYEKSTHYQVVRREDGKYTVNLIGDAFFEGWEGKQGVLYYHQANQGKYRIVELKAPASYNLKAWEHNTWVIGWSEEIIVHPDYPTYEFLGETASRNMPYKTKVLIKKVDDATGEFILPDTTWTLYEWNERNNQYEVSTNYKIVRREDGYYTVTTLHSDWTHYEEGYLYFEDTQTDYPDSGRWFSNEGKFLIVESQAPAGYYGDYWRNDEPGTHSTDNGSDLGKRGYAFTLTEDNGTLWLTNADYNAKILYNLDEGNATVVLADGRPTSVIINEKQQPSYERDETSFGNTAKYGYVVFDRSQYNKKWAQTGDDDTYTTSYEATTSSLDDQITAPEDNLWKNGKLFELEDYTAALISGPVNRQVTLENVKSLEDVPASMEYSLTDGTSITLHLVSADWLEEPRSSYTGFVDLGYSPKQPTANETETITADDGHTFTGHLVGIEQTGDYGWVDMEIPATYYGWPDVKGIFLGSLVLPHNDNKPVYEGYETEILTYLGFNNKDYKIVDAEWTGNWEALPGSDMMNRSATFTISVYATGWIARYEEGEEGERTGTATASYSFEDTASQEDGLYHWLVTAHYKPASVWTVLQAAAAVLGIGLVIAAVVLILFILSRKRKEKKRTTEKV